MSREARRWTVLLPCMLLAALVVIFAFRKEAGTGPLWIDPRRRQRTPRALPSGATGVALNKSTGLARQGITDGTGRFNFPDLPAGVYSLKASQQASRPSSRPRSR